MRIAQLVLVACVTGPSKETFLQRIMTMDENIQEALMDIIQQVLYTSEGNIAPPFREEFDGQAMPSEDSSEDYSPGSKEQKWVNERMVSNYKCQMRRPEAVELNPKFYFSPCRPTSRQPWTCYKPFHLPGNRRNKRASLPIHAFLSSGAVPCFKVTSKWKLSPGKTSLRV
eukprot:gb/GECG01005079.1/.p1 GENE.gb/GECG01005079.1/~~gb/GECG01005079.1/.p1  ORF type:complete len:170 (+),score=15.82 gb/GECG01005079.1/:1-510(+)